MKETITFKLNGKPVRFTGGSDRLLLWVLRSEFNLTGTKYGCGEGFCGACTVLVDNSAVRSCQLPVKNINGKDVLTIEGLAKNGKPHPLQEAFMKHNALQCGFCTPGMILSAYSFLLKTPRPTYAQIIAAMEGSLCRCSSYNRIVEAIRAAAPVMQGGRP